MQIFAGVPYFLGELHEIHNFLVSRSLLRDWLPINLSGDEIVLYIVCFAYSLLSLLLSLFFVVLLLVFVFSLLSYWTVFLSAHEFYLLSVSPVHPTAGGSGGVNEWLSGS